MKKDTTATSQNTPKVSSFADLQTLVTDELRKDKHFVTKDELILTDNDLYKTSMPSQTVSKEMHELFEENSTYFANTLAEFIFFRTYSRWRDDLGRRETWSETITRFMDFMRENIGDALKSNEYKEIQRALLYQEIIPSMRLVWSSGEAARSTNVAAYNCSYVVPTKLRDFAEIMYILMCGSAAGFSVERKTVDQLPGIARQTGKKRSTYVVSDTKEGWCDALLEGLETWFAGEDIEFDYAQIRAKGSRLKTMGGRAMGADPLIDLLTFTRELLLANQGRQLTSIQVHDLICKIGEIVEASGKRRAALISLSDLNDDEMRHAKSGRFYETAPYRSMANNSAVYLQKPTPEEFLEEWVALIRSNSGERGIFNRGDLLKQMPKRRRESFGDYIETAGTNPCGEINLRSRQFCNLTCIVVRPEDTEQDMKRKIKLATMLGTYQASLTNFPYLSKEWQKNCEEESLLGVSITGYWDNKEIRDEGVLQRLRDYAVKVNKTYAKRFGINQAASVTCVKPSGNSSQLLDTASGMHPRFAKYYIRRIRVSATDPIFHLLKDQHVPYEPEVGQHEDTATTFVFDFPVKAPKGAILKDDLSAIDLLEHWKMLKKQFTEHNPSVTVYVGDDEWIDVANWVYKNWDIVGGLSFLPRTNHVYKLAPYEEIDKKTYDVLTKQIGDIDFSQLMFYEQNDNTTGAKEYACLGGACEL